MTSAISKDRTRANTPDSGGGGYFTLSESDSGSNLGTESPQHGIERCNDVYRIYKTFGNDDDMVAGYKNIYHGVPNKDGFLLHFMSAPDT